MLLLNKKAEKRFIKRAFTPNLRERIWDGIFLSFQLLSTSYKSARKLVRELRPFLVFPLFDPYISFFPLWFCWCFICYDKLFSYLSLAYDVNVSSNTRHSYIKHWARDVKDNFNISIELLEKCVLVCTGVILHSFHKH